jgi:TonB family protein
LHADPGKSPASALLFAALLTATAFAATDDSARKLKNKVAPSYPELAKKLGIVGLVRLEVLVSAEGKVKSITVKGGHPLLADAAEKAVAKWRYVPGPEEAISVEVNFRPEQ